MKKILTIVILIALLGCQGRENLRKLEDLVEKSKKAMVSTDKDFIMSTINEIQELRGFYKESRDLLHRQITLEVRLKNYNNAIGLIDELIILNPDEIDYRIKKGILLEVLGKYEEAELSFQKALKHIDSFEGKTSTFGKQFTYSRAVNRVLVLKLLNMDSRADYQQIYNDTEAQKYTNVISALKLLQETSREDIIDRYR